MKYVKTYEQFNIEQTNEGFDEVVDGVTTIVSKKKRKLIKLLNDEDTTVEDMRTLIISLFDLKKGKGQEKKIEHVNELTYKKALNLLTSTLSKLEKTIKMPKLDLVGSELKLA